jgi:hypothetical protein
MNQNGLLCEIELAHVSAKGSKLPPMKTTIHLAPNRDRGYDATVYRVETVRLSALMRNLGASSQQPDTECPLFTVNAPSEAKARELAQSWIDAQPKQKRAKRAPSEGERESFYAARDEERAHGRD